MWNNDFEQVSCMEFYADGEIDFGVIIFVENDDVAGDFEQPDEEFEMAQDQMFDAFDR